jgi:outer membrane protein OmpA-like peptidoglycan-associated protein
VRHAILLAAAAFLITACASPDLAVSGSSQAIGANSPVDAQGTRSSQAASDFAPWTAYRTFDFNSTTVDISNSDTPKIYEIVAYLKSNPSLDVGIDGASAAGGIGEADRNLGDRRTASVRRALMDSGAGIASYKIFIGAFADPDSRHTGQIQVLVGPRTGSQKAAL